MNTYLERVYSRAIKGCQNPEQAKDLRYRQLSPKLRKKLLGILPKVRISINTHSAEG